MEYTYKYPRPAMTADCVLFGFDGQALKILLIERGIEPYKGYWALPGGFMKMDESIEQCAARELMEETGVRNVFMEQFRVFSDPGRDPRGRVVTVAFIALVRPSDHRLIAADDAANALWFDASMLPPLAFDHKEIVAAAREYLREAIRVRPVAFQLLNQVFTLEDLRRVYELINNRTYDRRNFQKKALQTELFTPAPEEDMNVASQCAAEPRPRGQFKAPEAPYSASRRGKPARHYRLSNIFKSKEKANGDDNGENEEGSVKDLFNF